MTSHMTNGLGSYDTSTMPQHSSSSTSPLGSFYGMSSSQSRSAMGIGMSSLSMGQWPSTPILSSNPVSFSSLQTRPSSDGSTGAPLHSPLTAQVYTDASLRTHSAQSIDVGDSTYSLQQHSPDQMLPECASTEPSKLFIATLTMFRSIIMLFIVTLTMFRSIIMLFIVTPTILDACYF